MQDWELLSSIPDMFGVKNIFEFMFSVIFALRMRRSPMF